MKTKLIFAILLISVLCLQNLSAAGRNEAAAVKPTVAGIIFQSDPFFRVVQKGMTETAGQLGANILMSSSNNNLERETLLVEACISRNVNAIMIAPLSRTASYDSLKQAYDSGIKIITYNTTLQDASIVSTHIAMSDTEAGKFAAQMALETEPDFGRPHGSDLNAAVICFDAQLPRQSSDRVDGFLDKLGERYNVNVVARESAWLTEMSVNVTTQILTEHQDNIDIIIAVNDGGTAGAVQAVKNAGLQDRIGVYGLSGPNEELASMLAEHDPAVHGMTFYEPYLVGELSVSNALKAIAGDNPSAQELVGYRLIRYGQTREASEYLELIQSFSE